MPPTLELVVATELTDSLVNMKAANIELKKLLSSNEKTHVELTTALLHGCTTTRPCSWPQGGPFQWGRRSSSHPASQLWRSVALKLGAYRGGLHAGGVEFENGKL